MNKTIKIVILAFITGILLFGIGIYVANYNLEPEVIEEVLGEVVIKKPIQIQPMTAPMLKIIEKQGVKNLNATEFNQLKASFKLRKANIISTGVININELTILNQATTRKIKESGKPLQINSSLNGVQYIEFLIESL